MVAKIITTILNIIGFIFVLAVIIGPEFTFKNLLWGIIFLIIPVINIWLIIKIDKNILKKLLIISLIIGFIVLISLNIILISYNVKGLENINIFNLLITLLFVSWAPQLGEFSAIFMTIFFLSLMSRLISKKLKKRPEADNTPPPQTK